MSKELAINYDNDRSDEIYEGFHGDNWKRWQLTILF